MPTFRNSFKSARTALLAAAILFSSAAALAEPNILREGEGSRRRQLDAMELKPFPKAAWDALSDWSGGSAPSEGTLEGKVVLIVTWADWYPTSVRAMALAKRLADKHAADGLIVIGVHDADGWKEAKKPKADAEGATLLHAVDTKGQFRTLVHQDQDPDFYIIDRAGQLRYADVDTSSVETAVDFLLGESKDAAGAINAGLAADRRDADAARRRSEGLRNSVTMTELPEVPFSMPRPESYKDVTWPPPPKDPNNSQPIDPKNPPPPVVVTMPSAGFFPAKPEFKGRAVMLYFWHPDLNASFNLIPKIDQVQRQYGRDVVVIGVMTPMTINSKEYKLDTTDIDKIKAKVEGIVNANNIRHVLLLDADGSLLKTVNKETTYRLPFGAVISSDNIVRHASFMGDSEFWGALDNVLRVDPGIKARRAAESEYLRSQGK